MEFKDRLIELREERDLSQKRLSEELGFSKSLISMYENGKRKPSYENLEAIADYFNVNLDYLTGASGDTGRLAKFNTLKDMADRIIAINYNDSDVKMNRSINLIPVIGSVAAGLPILADQNTESYFVLDDSIKADFALRIKGDSMIDEGINDGDIVFLRQQPTLENGEIGAVVIGEEATLKRFYRNNGFISLNAANRNYQPIVITSGDIRIAGKLVAVLNIR